GWRVAAGRVDVEGERKSDHMAALVSPSVRGSRSARTPVGVAFARLGSWRVNCAAVIPLANRTCHAWPPWPAGTEHRRQRPRFVGERFLNRRRLVCIPSFWLLPAQVF